MGELILGGCRPTPIAGYLKALGVFRLLAQGRPDWSLRGAWRDDRFVLSSPRFVETEPSARDHLEKFLLNDYPPTPIVAPWNGGSGFYPKDNTAALDRIKSGNATRFESYREVIAFAQESVHRHALTESPKNEKKDIFLTTLRGQAPESLLDWLDAAVVLTGDDSRYPPLLGTGGNDGRLDFTNNFMQRLCDLMDPENGAHSAPAHSWLNAALFGDSAPNMSPVAVGQFNPGGAGGPNASTGFEGGSLVNPWDFVLMLEGAILFAAAATRRLESAAPGTLAYPFTVRPAGAGNGGLSTGDEAQARAEIWMPLWDRFATVGELKRLLSEGRATLSARAVRDGLGFARAVAALGVDRGIGAFQRFGFLMRSGKAYLATPLTRVPVKSNPEARLIDDLEAGGFLDRLRRFSRDEQAPASIRSQVRRLEDALFDLVRRSDRYTLQKVLRMIGRICFNLSKSAKARDAVPVLPRLKAAWVQGADDGSPELRCAAALAGLNGTSLPILPFILPVSPGKGATWQWAPGSRTAVWHEGSLTENLGRIAARRHLEGADIGEAIPRAGACAADLRRFLETSLDERRLADLLLGLILTDTPARLPVAEGPAPLPAGYRVLKPCFAPHAQLVGLGFLAKDQTIPLSGELIASLRANHTQRAMELGWRRLRASGVSVPDFPRRPPAVSTIDGPRLLAALVIPLKSNDLSYCLESFGAGPNRTLEKAEREPV